MNLKQARDSLKRIKLGKAPQSCKRRVKDSGIVSNQAIKELVEFYNKVQNDEEVTKEEAVRELDNILSQFPNAPIEYEVVPEGDSWAIQWGDVGDVYFGFDCSSELWLVIREVIGSSQFEMDVAAPNNPGFGAERIWDEYRDSIGKATADITVIYGPWGSSNPTEIVAYSGDVADILKEWGAVFVPKGQYFHSSGEMCEITLIGDEKNLKSYIKDFNESEDA